MSSDYSGGDAETKGDSRHDGDEEEEEKEEYGAQTGKETVKCTRAVCWGEAELAKHPGEDEGFPFFARPA